MQNPPKNKPVSMPSASGSTNRGDTCFTTASGFADGEFVYHCSSSGLHRHLVSPPGRFRTGASGDAPLVSPTRPEPLLGRKLEFPFEFGRRFLAMNEITETPAYAAFTAVQPAAGFPKIGHRTEFAVNRARGIPAAVERVAGGLCRVFVFEPRVHVPDQVVIVVVADDDLLDLPVLAHLAPDVLIESIEVVLDLLRGQFALWVICRVLVEIRHEDGLRIGRFDVLARAPVAMAARADFVVKRAVDLRREDMSAIRVYQWIHLREE